MVAWLVALLLLGAPGIDAGDLDALVKRSKVPRARLGIAVGPVGAGPLYVIHPKTPRIPASNQKIVTAAVALKRLGRDYRFATKIVLADNGDLCVIGGGDPNHSGRFFGGDASKVLRLIARDVAAKGVKVVRGNLVLDATRFDDVYVNPDWPKDQLDRWYCAPVAALVYNDSCWDVAVTPGAAAGAPARVEILPSLVRPDVANTCSTVITRAKHVVHIGRGAKSGLMVRGGILHGSPGIEQNVAVRDPVAFYGAAFRAALEAEGIRIRGESVRGKAPGKHRALVLFESSLERTLEVALTNSQNLYSECIFKILGSGSSADAARVTVQTLAAMKVDVTGIAVRDGSGLARTNRVTPKTLYDVLQGMADEPMFTEALAGGGEGTLRRRYRDLGERVRLKTGTIRGVSCLSGYVTAKDGTRWVMVVLCNGASPRRLQDSIVKELSK